MGPFFQMVVAGLPVSPDAEQTRHIIERIDALGLKRLDARVQTLEEYSSIEDQKLMDKRDVLAGYLNPGWYVDEMSKRGVPKWISLAVVGRDQYGRNGWWAYALGEAILLLKARGEAT